MGNIPFVPNCTWVHLYINSQYRGLYMVTDHVEIANDRVEIQEGGTGDSLGFLVELDMRGDKDEGVVEDLDYFYIENYPHNSGAAMWNG